MTFNKTIIRLILIAAFALTGIPSVRSATPYTTDFSLCGPPLVPTPFETTTPDSTPDGPIGMTADHAEGDIDGEFRLSGNVRLQQGERRLETESLSYSRDDRQVKVDSPLRYFDRNLIVEGESAHIDLAGQAGSIKGAQYYLPSRHVNGRATSVDLLDQQHFTLHGVSYTTCNPDHIDWQLLARQVKIDQSSGQGEARDARITFKGVPLMYLPYISFPIDDRRISGFLLPRLGSTGESGFEISVPYYWNIAPDRDATFTPRLLSQRGLQMQGQYRYLTERGRGQLDIEYLPHDRMFSGDRNLFAYRQRGDLTSRWTTAVNINNVSDDNYFEELGDSLSVASTTHLERAVETTYYGDYWSVLGRLQDFQTLSGPESYRRLPQVQFNGELPQHPLGLYAELAGEYTFFDRDSGVTGSRIDLQPGVSLPLGGDAWFVTPAFSLRHTAYRLTDADPGTTDRPTRTTPITSLDSGLFFEREAVFGGLPMVQTLEPRLYYLYVPHRNQDELPVFDSTDLDFSFQQLFRTNRFSGADRVGDANQVTLALTSRFLESETGVQRAIASIGQAYYFADRKVTLEPGDPVETTKRSDLIGEVIGRITRDWSAGTTVYWDTDANQTDKGVVFARYRPDSRALINIAYRYRRELLEQADIVAMWPLSARWNAVARWNRSLQDDVNLELLAGVEYQSCCYAIDLVWRSYVNDASGDRNSAVFLQFELKGFTRLGRGIADLLERDMLDDY